MPQINDFSWLSLSMMIFTFLSLIFLHMSFFLSFKSSALKVPSLSNFFFSSL